MIKAGANASKFFIKTVRNRFDEILIKIWKFDGIKFFIYTVSSNAFHQDALLQKFSGQHMHQNFHQNPSKLQFWWKAWCIWKEPKIKKSSKKYRKEGKNRFWWSLMNFVLEQTFYFWWNCLKCIKQFDEVIFLMKSLFQNKLHQTPSKSIFSYFSKFFCIFLKFWFLSNASNFSSKSWFWWILMKILMHLCWP